MVELRVGLRCDRRGQAGILQTAQPEVVDARAEIEHGRGPSRRLQHRAQAGGFRDVHRKTARIDYDAVSASAARGHETAANLEGD